MKYHLLIQIYNPIQQIRKLIIINHNVKTPSRLVTTLRRDVLNALQLHHESDEDSQRADTVLDVVLSAVAPPRGVTRRIS